MLLEVRNIPLNQTYKYQWKKYHPVTFEKKVRIEHLVSGRFKLSWVHVTESKTAVNICRKSRQNRFGFELARVQVIGSRLYFSLTSAIVQYDQ